MNEESIKIKISKPFGNLYRDRCVLVAAFDDKHNLLLGAKPDFYPPGIVRLLTWRGSRRRRKYQRCCVSGVVGGNWGCCT